jgi:hypothetical protein
MSNTQCLGSCFGLGLIMLLLGCQSQQPTATSNPTNIETPVVSVLPTKPVTLSPARSPAPPGQAPQAAKPPTATASVPESSAPESFIGEGTLTAKDPKAQINLRSTASATSKLLGYGVVGDRVDIIAQKETEGYTWNLVKFPKSGTKAWIRGDFVKTGIQSSSTSPLPVASPKSAAGSAIRKPDAASNCECPYDTDKAGKSCGKRSAYSKTQGKKPICYVGES